MPKETFLNLPKEKQDSIYKAAMKEFCRVPFNEASINQIIQNANISRGSFYMYFEDKEDLYDYIMIAHRKSLEQQYIKMLKEHHGDLIETYLDLFNKVAGKMVRQKEQPFLRKMIMNTNFHNHSLFEKGEHERVLMVAYQLLDHTKLNIQNEADFKEVIEMIHLLFIHALMKVSKWNLEIKEVYISLERQLSILKNGLYCKEGKK